MDSLLRLAEGAGCRVVFRDIGEYSGLTYPNRIIVINSKRTRLTQRAALAHEISHVYFQHDWRREHNRERDELEANRMAANLLISVCAYERAEHLVGPDPRALGQELDVPSRLVRLWQEQWGDYLRRTCAYPREFDVA